MVRITVYNKSDDKWFDVAIDKEWSTDSDAWTYIPAGSYDVWKRNGSTTLWVRDDKKVSKYKIYNINHHGGCYINIYDIYLDYNNIDQLSIEHLENYDR